MNIFKILLITSYLALCACQQQPAYQELKEELSQSLQEINSKISKEYQKHEDGIGKLANAELDKLQAIEYHVFELGSEESTEQHQQKLNEIGKERWDCFFIDKSNEFYRVYCRRTPKSYLRYLSRIPNFIP